MWLLHNNNPHVLIPHVSSSPHHPAHCMDTFTQQSVSRVKLHHKILMTDGEAFTQEERPFQSWLQTIQAEHLGERE